MADLILGSEHVTPDVKEALEHQDDDRETVPIVLASTGQAVTAEMTPAEQKRHHRVRGHMQARRQRKASAKALLDAKKLADVPLSGVNLRDVGAVAQGPLQIGRVFRSSELLSKEEMRVNGIQTILDLRRMDRPCKKDPSGSKVAESTKTVIKYLLLGPKKLVPEKRLLYVHRAHPRQCTVCHDRAGSRFMLDLHVIHADLIPSTVGLRIFQAMPAKVQLKALLMALAGKGAASVMAPAVANPLLLGYTALYRTLLEDSKRGMAMALRPFVEADNYPILVHCIHGKDRTGLIIMLLLMVCDVKPEAIVDDYVLSETVLKESRMHDELKLDVYLTSDDVIAATRDTMEQTIAYINDKYGGAAGYMHEIGMEDWEIANIRTNLKEQDKTDEGDEATEPSQPTKHKFGFHTLLPFSRRSSAPQAESRIGGLRRRSSPVPRSTSLSTEDLPSRKEVAEPAIPEDGPQVVQPPIPPRRASLANTGPQEIRAMLRQLREEHPELGPLSEEDAPVDFLRDSPKSKRTHQQPLSAPTSFAVGRSTEDGDADEASDSKLEEMRIPDTETNGKAASETGPSSSQVLASHGATHFLDSGPPPTSPFELKK